MVDGARQSPYPIVRLICPEIDTQRGLYQASSLGSHAFCPALCMNSWHCTVILFLALLTPPPSLFRSPFPFSPFPFSPLLQLKQKALGEIYRKLLSLEKTSKDAALLVNWRDPSKGGGGGRGGQATGAVSVLGDYALTVHQLLEQRIGHRPSSLTVAQVNAMLDRLVKCADAEERTKFFQVPPPPPGRPRRLGSTLRTPSKPAPKPVPKPVPKPSFCQRSQRRLNTAPLVR